MDNKQEHLENLSEIRSLMERSSSFISLSGLSGIIAGIMGFLMAILLYTKLGEYLSRSYIVKVSPAERQEQIIFTLIVSVIVLAVTFASTFFLTTRKAKKAGLPVWGEHAKNMLVNLFVPLITGGIFCLFLLINNFDFIVLPSMIIFYGLALLNAAKYTLHEVKWLGISEIVTGLAALLLIDYAILFFAVGFGLMNIIYGAIMYFRHER